MTIRIARCAWLQALCIVSLVPAFVDHTANAADARTAGDAVPIYGIQLPSGYRD
jgi:hypothetical protein